MITVYNDNEGIEALIRALNNGSYSVTICDTESGQTLPTAKIFKEYNDARQYANKICSIQESA